MNFSCNIAAPIAQQVANVRVPKSEGGIAYYGNPDPSTVQKDLQELQKRIDESNHKDRTKIVDAIMPWLVFILCLIFSGIGVGLSFFVFGKKILGVELWGVGLAISIVMLGISYGAKYANPDARKSFTPVDLIQYFTQGFLWPSTWPALADFIGVSKISPANHSWLFDYHDKLVTVAHLFSEKIFLS